MGTSPAPKCHQLVTFDAALVHNRFDHRLAVARSLATMVAVSCGRHFTTSAVRMGQWLTAKMPTIVDSHVAAVRRTWTTGEAPPSARGYRWASLARRVPLTATKKPNLSAPGGQTSGEDLLGMEGVEHWGWVGRWGLRAGRVLWVLKKIGWHGGCLVTWRGKFLGRRVG